MKAKPTNRRRNNFFSMGIPIAIILLGFMVSFVSADVVYVDPNDPYDPNACPLSLPPGTGIIYTSPLPDAIGDFSFQFNPDDPMMIGDYIQSNYPDIWAMLSPEQQQLYNLEGVIWYTGAAAPVLPGPVKKLIALKQAFGSRPIPVYQNVTSLPAYQDVSSPALHQDVMASYPSFQSLNFVTTGNFKSGGSGKQSIWY
jgi:hypothetical protein